MLVVLFTVALSATACASAPTAPNPTLAIVLARADAGRAVTSTEIRDESCSLRLEAVCSPLVTDRGVCWDDSTRWVRLARSGACRYPDPRWDVSPVGHRHEAQVFAWGDDPWTAYVRGWCGRYRVVAATGDERLTVDVELPGPLCDATR